MTDTKAIVFDMDGTLADFYGVSGWLDDLHNSNPRPYINANPLLDMVALENVLNALKEIGYRIIVTSWLAKGSTKAYDKEVRKAKREWLEKYNFPADEIHLVKYGTPKQSVTRKYDYQILFDDNESVRNSWNKSEKRIAYNEKNIIDNLVALMV